MSEKQTFNLGKKLAQQLKGGEVLALIGELGAGKTVLVKGIAKGLGIKKIITSPTFVLMKIYEIQATSYKFTPHNPSKARICVGLQANKLVHIDCYRIKNPQEIVDIGATEYFGQKDTVVVIEWADIIKKILPKDRLEIEISLKGEKGRKIVVKQDKAR